jgi:orotate phosphoribosyltransferase
MISPYQVKQAVLEADVYIEGHFVFADGNHSLNKLEIDHLWHHPDCLEVVLQALSEARDLPAADLILGVPSGGQRLAEALAVRTGLPLARLARVPGGAKQDFHFASPADAKAAAGAKSPRVYEDVVSTLSSIAGVIRLLDPSRQDIHALAIWRRGQPKPAYTHGFTAHYLVEAELPSFAPANCPKQELHTS